MFWGGECLSKKLPYIILLPTEDWDIALIGTLSKTLVVSADGNVLKGFLDW